MLVLVNIGALVIVVALCWFGLRYVSGRVHSRRLTRVGGKPDGQPCRECDGVGAVHHFGRIQPCPICEGTGVERAPF